jgi:hypothetical protein
MAIDAGYGNPVGPLTDNGALHRPLPQRRPEHRRVYGVRHNPGSADCAPSGESP